MQVRCPHCQTPVDLSSDAQLSDIVCPACGSSFSLLGTAETASYKAKTRTIGHFELIDQIGVGAFGFVWRARDKELDRTVAVKIPRKGQLDPDEAEQFLREARAAAQLRHPNIVSVHEVGREHDSVFIVSDFVEGVTLTDRLTAQRFSACEAAELCTKVADALHHAHEAGVIHRDLKPGNVILDTASEPHIMDFGLARREAGEVTMTVEGRVLGTPAYMSPEQAKGLAHTADRRSDVYSLGVILFELLTGERPFRGNSRMLVHQVIYDEPPSPRRLIGSVPRDLETICLKCLAKDPSSRYSTAKVLADDLRRFLAREPILARPITALERKWRWCKRRPVVAALSAALLLALGSGFVGVTWQWRLAKQNLRESDGRLAQMWTERGVRAELDGNIAHAMSLWAQAVATRETSGLVHEGQDTVNRLRLAIANLHLARPCIAIAVDRGSNSSHRLIASPDGRRALTEVTVDGAQRSRLTNMVLWNLETGAKIGLLSDVEAYSAYFSANGKLIVTKSASTMTVWNADTAKPFSKDLHNMTVNNLALSGDGTWMVTRTNASFHLRHLATGTRQELPWTFYKCVYLANDGTLFVLDPHTLDHVIHCQAKCNSDHTITLEPIQRIQLEGSQDQPSSPRSSVVRFLNGGTHLLIKSEWSRHDKSPPDKRVSIWHLPDGKRLCTYPLNRPLTRARFDGPSSGHYSGFGSFGLFSDFSSEDLWNEEYTPLSICGVVAEGTHSVIAQEEGSRGSKVSLWDSLRGESVSEIHADKALTHASEDGRTLIISDATVGTLVWRAGIGLPRSPPLNAGAPIAKAVFSPDGKSILTAQYDNTARLWSLSDAPDSKDVYKHDGLVVDAQWAPDGRLFATASWDETAKIWRLDSRSTEPTVLKHGGRVQSVEFDSTGHFLLTSCHDGSAYLWHVNSGELIYRFEHGGSAIETAISRDGQQIITGGTDGIVRLWRCMEGRWTEQRLFQNSSAILDASFSPRGDKLLAGYQNGTAQLWGTAHGEKLGNPFRHRDSVLSVCFSPDGERVATGGLDSSARIWSAEDGSPLSPRLTHNGPVCHVTFSPDGLLLATATQSGEAQLWEAATGLRVGLPLRHSGPIRHVGFGLHGEYLLSASDDGTARVWALPLPIQAPADQLVQQTGRRVMGCLDAGGELQPIYPSSWATSGRHNDRPFAIAESYSVERLKLFSSWARECVQLGDWEAAWTDACAVEDSDRNDGLALGVLKAARAGLFVRDVLPTESGNDELQADASRLWHDVYSHVQTVSLPQYSSCGINVYRDLIALSVEAIQTNANLAEQEVPGEAIVGVVYDVRDLVRTRTDLEALRQLAEEFVSPDSWRKNGGSCFSCCLDSTLSLFVAQTESCQDVIRRCFDRLRSVTGVNVSAVPISNATRDEFDGSLDIPVDIESKEIALIDLLRTIALKCRVELKLDEPALQEVGVASDTLIRVPRGFDTVSTRMALTMLLDRFHLTYYVQNNVGYVTTREKLELVPEVWVHPVHDLASDDEQANRLTGTIIDLVDFDTWDEVGGPGAISYFAPRKCLIVSQKYATQERIRHLLSTLREVDQAGVEARDTFPGEEKETVFEALQQPIDVEFQNEPLEKAIASLSRQLGVNIVLGERALDEAKIDATKATITSHLKECVAENALTLVLGELGLRFQVRNDVVYVTTPDELEEMLETWVYPVHDLAPDDDQANRLVGSITGLVAADTWDKVGGPGDISYFAPRKCLIVSQTREIQKELRGLLSGMRSAPSPPPR